LIKRPEKWIKTYISHQKDIIKTYHTYGYAGGMMFRSSALSNCSCDVNFPICEDFDFHIQLLKLGKIKSLHEPLYLYRSHQTNYCKKFSKTNKLEILEKSLKKNQLWLY
jgi:hypothetical protein